MKFKNLMFVSLVGFAILHSANVSAEIATVAYHCPTIKKAGDIDLRTTINHKDVTWYIEKGSNVRGDKPVDFIGAFLERQNDDSFDMSVKCIYKTNANKKYVLSPIKSFLWYVDAVAEKPIGKGWKSANNGVLMCNKSIKECGFYFR